MMSRFSIILSSLVLGIVTTQCFSLLTDSGTETEIANRYQLRLRTSKFYNRASTKGRHALLPRESQDPALLARGSVDLNDSDI